MFRRLLQPLEASTMASRTRQRMEAPRRCQAQPLLNLQAGGLHRIRRIGACSRFSTKATSLASAGPQRRVYIASPDKLYTADFARPSANPEDPPYDRFRGNSRGLSVTDLLSNMWCEQQNEFYLTRGKKKSTPAMRAGTKIHQKLEQEVHKPVVVEVLTKEDRWGLKLLNIAQGLRTLRERGFTRELPVFAFVKGMFVQGVIDEISYTKPPTGIFEEGKEPHGLKWDETKEQNSHNDGQLSITQFLGTPRLPKTAYISDCKTRVKPTVPPDSQLQGTKVQLMLYHYLIRAMAASVAATVEHYMKEVTPDPQLPTQNISPPSTVPPDQLMTQLFLTHNLDPHAKLSDRFLQQMAPLLDESDSETESFDKKPIIRYPSLTDILANPTLAGLMTVLSTSFSLALPNLSDSLFVSYRSQVDSRLFATLEVSFAENVLEEHLVDVLHWWKGERATVGVPIEEAWKCRSCEFADNCEWRLGKIEQLKSGKNKEREAFSRAVKKTAS
ncbi:exonuclease V [Peziza echinospora]|nr:exonuclease V [Peziza echinospora]